jgi:trehalose 6-phosphate synthase/phosphatase
MQWSPVLYFYRSLSIEELSALYQIADIGLVTPMRDGMNLVSKEYVASRTDNNGVLILSEMAGASKELIDALIVNPNNIGDITRAIVQALNMTLAEQETKMAEMRKVVSQFNIFHWVKIYMDKLQEVKELQRSLQSRHVDQSIAKTIITRYSAASKRIIFLDYDGTLVNFNSDINKASPDSGLYQLLAKLSADKANEIVLISGRDHNKMEEWFGNSGVHIIAEHGVWQKEIGGNWTSIMGLTDTWKEEIFPILNTYVERTPGSFIEEKSFSLVWHFRKVPKDLGDLRVSELVNNLVYLTKDKGLQLLPGNKVIEIKNIEINKGKAALNFMFKKDYDFIMAIGDDHTDEDIFKALPDSAFTFKVGSSLSAARFYLRNSGDVRQFLHHLSSE